MSLRTTAVSCLAAALCLAPCLGLSSAAVGDEAAAKFTPQQVEFFTKDVLPILQVHCFSCHGGEQKIQSGFRLTSRELVIKGGENGPAVSLEKPDESLLLEAIQYKSLEMPPKGKLPQAQIDVLTRWVKMGLPWSDEAAAAALKPHGVPKVDDKARAFWSFQPVKRPQVPEVKNQAWVRNPIDAFILAPLEAKGVGPAPPADKTALLRRVSYTVTGLPPTPAEVDAFLADSSPSAYEKVVDKLLASRHYGEYWGRHWLDLVHFAETNSFERDGPKPNAWKYRDYVIRSFNDDKPYDQFIREQLAGDELEPVTREGVIATAYYRLGIWDDEPADPELAYYDQLDDILSTTGQTFLGLTVGCARCHDHKIDPFPQKDYYRLLAFFHGINPYGNGPGALRVLEGKNETLPELGGNKRNPVIVKQFNDELAKLEGKAAQFARQIRELDKKIAVIEERAGEKLIAGERDDFARPESRLAILEKRVGDIISKEDFERYQALRKERDELEKNRPAALETTLAVIEQGPVARETFVLTRGMPAAKADKVEPGFPSVLFPPGTPDPLLTPAAKEDQSSGRRRVVADWIADPKNPLTARVLVNRLWQYNFGRGIVRSSSNFGYMGSPPTHPELLDWLASEFASEGMKLKPIQRLILTSNAFRMSAEADPQVAAKDPENDWLSHFDQRRLTAEEIRDSVLAVSGNLNLKKADGPSIYPVIPPEVLAGQSRPGDGWGKSTPEEAASRSVFVYIKRSLAVPLLASFDTPDPDATCPVRFTTTQPSQALGMLNSQFLAEQSRTFARSVRTEAGDEPAAQVRAILRRVMQREPTQAEVDRGLTFIRKMQEQEKLNAEDALARFCLLAMNLNEFFYLD